MKAPPSALEQLHQAYDLIDRALQQAPQLYACHLDQALLLLVLALRRARRSPKLRRPRPPADSPQPCFAFWYQSSPSAAAHSEQSKRKR